MSDLEVPVNDAILVAVVHALQDLLDAVRGVGLGVELAGHDVLEQLSAGHPAKAQIDGEPGKNVAELEFLPFFSLSGCLFSSCSTKLFTVFYCRQNE